MVSLAVAAIAVTAPCACTAGDPGPGIDVDRAMANIAAQVAMGPRPGDSDEARATLAWIERELAASKIAGTRTPVGSVELPRIEVLGRVYRERKVVHTTDDNLVVRFGPAGDAPLLIMAHYDTVEVSPGATDNATAVALLIELARRLANHPPSIPVVLAFTANEEIGLVGAEALAAQLRPSFAISLDLVGGSGPLVINGASELVGLSELGWLADAADRAGVVVRVPLAHRVVSRWWPQSERSDHGPFTRRGAPAVHLYHRGQDGEKVDLAYHSPRDTFERVDRRSVDELGRLLVALVGGGTPVAAPLATPGVATPDTTTPVPPRSLDGFWLPVLANIVVPRLAIVGIELVLALVALWLVVRWPPRPSPQRRGLGLVAGIACVLGGGAIVIAIERQLAGDHPAPWLHAPRSYLVGTACMLVAIVGLLARLAGRFAPPRWFASEWTGERRYLAIAVALPLAIGVTGLVIGAAELAWIWLVPAAITAIASRIRVLRWVALCAQLLPAVLVLEPDQLREAAWHGFLPVEIPLAGWVALLAAAPLATLAWTLRSRETQSGPLGTLVLPVGCALVGSLGFLMILRAAAPCTAAEFQTFHLTCEVHARVR